MNTKVVQFELLNKFVVDRNTMFPFENASFGGTSLFVGPAKSDASLFAGTSLLVTTAATGIYTPGGI